MNAVHCRHSDVARFECYSGHEWWFLGDVEISCFSTCKGKTIRIGESVTFSFPKPDPRRSGIGCWRGKASYAASEIVRFSAHQDGEIGRLPTEWARCLIPLFNADVAKIHGFCVAAPPVLGLMTTVILSVGLYIKHTFLESSLDAQQSLIANALEDSTIHLPLQTLFRLLRKEPFIKAEFTPEDLYKRKRSLSLKDGSVPLLPASKRQRQTSGSGKEIEEAYSGSDLNTLVGSSDSCFLEEMQPPDSLLCELRSYQKQALFWMSKMEKGKRTKEAAKSIHPCWDAYKISDRRASTIYVNSFSGVATTDFPSALRVTRGGILADAMGLGKTVMTISLILSNSSKGGFEEMTSDAPAGNGLDMALANGNRKIGSEAEKFTNGVCKGGGTLIVCPMTLLGQWKTELETHARLGPISVYVHYGQTRFRDPGELLDYDVVLTTYGMLGSAYTERDKQQNVLHAIHWFRIVLDEAHTIKSSKCQVSQSAFALVADCRWCLTGTPIQNKLEDIFSLLHFLRIEPWGNWKWWNKLIQKPYEMGDEGGLNLVKAILGPLMLRRTKDSTYRDGRPILVLPLVDSQVIECNFSEAENDFYAALFKRSKVKFDEFVAQGKVLHNYASILELLLRLRQCCDHPFLVLSRGDTKDFADLNKLTRRFLDGASKNSNSSVPSKAYVECVVEEIQNGKREECPICLELLDDGVITPCAHRMCRECLLSSWCNLLEGPCPMCRKVLSKRDLITLPTNSRFRVDIEKKWKESSKVSTLLKHLSELRVSGLKSVVFSQWTSFLDLLEIPLKRNRFQFVRLDGSLSQFQREKVIKDFSDRPCIKVMLISLKAGGVGLNLTAASYVFIMDPWWNPAVEEQAIMRIHRIGQKRNVVVRRFIVKGTVEERMQQVQARKQRLIAGALTDEQVRSTRMEELKMLFR